jgi:hypothetical protein
MTHALVADARRRIHRARRRQKRAVAEQKRKLKEARIRKENTDA